MSKSVTMSTEKGTADPCIKKHLTKGSGKYFAKNGFRTSQTMGKLVTEEMEEVMLPSKVHCLNKSMNNKLKSPTNKDK